MIFMKKHDSTCFGTFIGGIYVGKSVWNEKELKNQVFEVNRIAECRALSPGQLTTVKQLSVFSL